MPFNNAARKIVKKIVGYTVCRVPILNKAIYDGLTIFIFHDISDSPSDFCIDNKLSISTDKFTQIIIWIQENYAIISPQELFNYNKFPQRSALITFDDGFKGSFVNGLPVLEKMDIPSLFFLNMGPVINGNPMLSAVACYLDNCIVEFSLFCAKKNVKKPYHLTLTPDILEEFIRRHGNIDYQSVLKYQGEFVDMDLLKATSKNKLVYYANHLYDHWNVRALKDDQFVEQYHLNRDELMLFDNYIDCFAFTNGEPQKSYSEHDIAILKNIFSKKSFSALPVVNRFNNKHVLHRVSLIHEDVDCRYIYYKMFRGYFNRLFKFKHMDI